MEEPGGREGGREVGTEREAAGAAAEAAAKTCSRQFPRKKREVTTVAIIKGGGEAIFRHFLIYHLQHARSLSLFFPN